MARLEDIVFWILILTIIGVTIWLAFGSPDFEDSLLMILIFVAGSEILLWKAFFSIDKKTAIGFEKIKNEIKSIGLKTGRIENLVLTMDKKFKAV